MCNSLDLTRLDAARPGGGGGGGAMPLPRAGTGGMVQYLEQSEPVSRARLERSALFARKASPAVGARFETQGWAWREAKEAAVYARRKTLNLGVGLLALALALAKWLGRNGHGVAAHSMAQSQ